MPTATTVRVSPSRSASFPVTSIVTEVPSAVPAESSAVLGGSLTGTTVIVNARVVVVVPSLTVTVIVTIPFAFGTGWNVSVPFADGLVYATTGAGTTDGSLLTAVS